MRTRSITGPLILVVIGVLFLLNNLGHDIPFWRYLADYWPFLLIGIGIIRLAEVLFHFSRGSSLPVRSGGGGWIWILVILALPAIWFSAAGVHLGRIGTPGSLNILGSVFDYGVTASSSTDGVTRLVLDNINGDLTVHGNDSNDAGDVKVTGHKTVRAFNHGDADRADKETTVHLERQGDSLVLRADDPTHSGMLSISTDLDIVVPKGLNVEARGRGDINIEDMAGTVSVTESRGDVRLNNIGKDVRVEAARGGLVRAAGVKGTVDLQGRGGDLQLEDVAGQVTINGEFSGTLEFRGLAKAIHFESSHSDFRAEQVPGSITMDLGNLKMDNVVGPVKFRTGNRDIDATDITNSIELNVDRGDIEITESKAPLPKMDVHTRNGNITLTVPDKAGFDLDATTGAGEGNNEFGEPLSNHSDGRSAYIKGKVGSGPALVLATDRGNLAVKKK
jgi:DUF4097 and DUF4098 domain-containing protein YvlB